MHVFLSFLLIGIGIALGVCLAMILLLMLVRSRDLRIHEDAIRQIVFDRIAKIPALIEIMRSYSAHPDAFHEMIELYGHTIIATKTTLHDTVETSLSMDREIGFLLRLSAQMPEIQRDRMFLYLRDFILFSETAIRRELQTIDRDISLFNRLVFWKNCTIIGLLVPISEREPV